MTPDESIPPPRRPATKTPDEVEDAKLAVRAMLIAGSPLRKIRGLLRDDGFSDDEIDSVLRANAEHLPRDRGLVRLALYGTAGVAGMGYFFYTALFRFHGVTMAFLAPLVLGVWGLFNFLSAARSAPAGADDRRSVIHKQSRPLFWRILFPD